MTHETNGIAQLYQKTKNKFNNIKLVNNDKIKVDRYLKINL